MPTKVEAPEKKPPSDIKTKLGRLADLPEASPVSPYVRVIAGRRVSFIIERRLKWENEGWKLAPSEGAGYDMIDPQGRLWEVRSITRGGVYFNP